MKVKLLIISVLCSASLVMCRPLPDTPEQLLARIPLIDSVKRLDNDSLSNFVATYELWFRMPIDHQHPGLGSFPLRAYYSHRGFDRPMVAVIDGYKMYTWRANELTKILDANQLTIEHRFFKPSCPPDSIPWAYLTVRQAAADQHAIIQQFKQFYKQKWVSTGISKSGQTTIYHRWLYPADVDVSVPYVAPLNFSSQDPRIYTFLDQVGTPLARQKIRDFQLALFQNKSQLLPMFARLAEEKGWTFGMGLERAYDLSVLEYPFSFWQWGHDPERIPTLPATPEALFAEFQHVNPFTFFEDKSVEDVRPFFFQAMTEVGMYGYRIEPFRQYLRDTADVLFDFTMPRGWPARMNPETMLAVDRWVRTQGHNMLYIYGENDPWSATAVTLEPGTNAVKMVNPGGSHSTRIKSFPPAMRDSILTVLGQWLQMDLSSQMSVNTSN